MLKIENLTSENLGDVFKICSFNRPEDDIVVKGREIRTTWLTKTLEELGSCTKIAYYEDRPVAQILFYPEEEMRYISNRRKGVIHIQCVYNAFQETQGLGAGTALVNSLIEDSKEGLEVLNGDPCAFLVGYPFPSTEGITLSEFFPKIGFKKGNNEYYLEINSEYYARETPENPPLPEDKGKVIIFYNPTCEFGYFYANQAKLLLQQNFKDLPIAIYNVWENYEEYLKRTQQSMVAARAIINQKPINDFLFWTDIESWLDGVKTNLRN